jgi:hypothetical protein
MGWLGWTVAWGSSDVRFWRWIGGASRDSVRVDEAGRSAFKEKVDEAWPSIPRFNRGGWAIATHLTFLQGKVDAAKLAA